MLYKSQICGRTCIRAVGSAKHPLCCARLPLGVAVAALVAARRVPRAAHKLPAAVAATALAAGACLLLLRLLLLLWLRLLLPAALLALLLRPLLPASRRRAWHAGRQQRLPADAAPVLPAAHRVVHQQRLLRLTAVAPPQLLLLLGPRALLRRRRGGAAAGAAVQLAVQQAHVDAGVPRVAAKAQLPGRLVRLQLVVQGLTLGRRAALAQLVQLDWGKGRGEAGTGSREPQQCVQQAGQCIHATHAPHPGAPAAPGSRPSNARRAARPHSHPSAASWPTTSSRW